MKKRILAMLLAGTLAVSGLPIIAGANESAAVNTAVDPLAAASWSSNVTEVDDVLGDGDTYQYLHVYNIDYFEDGVIYEDKNTIMLKGHEYRLSFWYRCAQTENWPITDSTSGEGIRELRLFGYGNVNLISTYASEGNIIGNERLIATSEWQRATVLIKPTADTIAWFKFREGKNFEDVIPFDIYGFSLVELDEFGYTGEEMIKYGDVVVGATNCWWPNSAKGKIITESEYMHATDEAAVLSGVKLEAGRYTVSADIRMTKYDFKKYTVSGYNYTNNNSGNLTVTASNGAAVSGTDTFAVNNEWQTVSFEVDAQTATDSAALSFKLDNSLGIDITNVTVTKSAAFGNFADESGNALFVQAEGIENEYIHFTGLNSPDDELRYQSDIALDTAKTYVLSVNMRAAETENWATYYADQQRQDKNEYIREVEITVAGRRIGFVAFGDDWNTFEWEFTPVDSAFSMSIKEGSGYHGYYDIIPYDIDDIKLVEKESGEVLIAEGTAETSDGWVSYNPWHTPTTKAVVETETEYYRLRDSVSFAYTGDETLEAGIYNISLDVRINTFDGAKFTWKKESNATFSANNNRTAISLKLNGEAVESTDGAISVEVNNGTTTLDNSWKTISFMIALTESAKMSDLVFELEKEAALEFRNFTVESATHLYSDEYITVDGEYISKVDLVENEYISVSGLGVAGDGAVYKDPDVSVTAGKTYTLTFDVRAVKSPDWENTVEAKGFSTRIRGKLNGGTPSGIMKATDDWTTVTTTVTAGKDGGLSLELIEYDIWDFLSYDIDNFSLICDETGENLIEHGMTVENGGGMGWTPLVSIYRVGAPTEPEIAVTNDLQVRVLAETDYLSIPSSASGNNGFVYNGDDDYIAKGIWHITGDFRLPEFRMDKLEMSTYQLWGIDFPYIINDNNYANLNAYVDGKALAAIDGRTEGVKVSTGWTNGGFILVVDSASGMKKSDIEFTLDDGTALDFKNIVYTPVDDLYLENFTNGEGTPISIINAALNTETGEIGNFDNSYVRIYNITYAPNGANLKDSSVTLEEGTTYELSFWARSMQVVNWPVKPDASSTRQLYVSQIASAGKRIGIINLYEDWRKYDITFTSDYTTSLGFSFADGNSFNDIVPFDIDGMTLYALDAETGDPVGNNLMTVSENIGKMGWSASSVSLAQLSDTEFYRAAPPSDTSANTSIIIDSDEILEPGKYYITGKFRIGDPIDFNKIEMTPNLVSKLVSDSNTAMISASLTNNGLPLLTLSEKSEVSITPYTWTEVVFVLDTAVPIDMNTIKFEVDENIQLDFVDVNIELVERKISLSDVNNGFIVTLLMLKDLNKYNGYSESDIAIDRDWVISGPKATIIKTGTADSASNSYISVSSRQSSDTGAVYNNNAAIFSAGKQYQVSFNARTINATKEGAPLIWGLRVIASDGTTLSQNVKLSEEWSKLSFKFTAKTDATIAITLKGASGEEHFYPFDVDDFSIIELETGNDLAVKGTSLYNGKYSAGWSVVNYGDKTASLRLVSENNYFSANISGGITYQPKEKVILEPGQYYLSGKFRVTSMEYEKLELDKSNPGIYGHIVTADNNVVGISAYFGDTQLKLADGATKVNAGTAWTTVKFPFGLTEATDVSGLKFVSDTDVTIFLDDFKIAAANGDNPIADAVSEDGLANWSVANQTLEYKVDVDGTKYLAARNITNNRVGFTYKPEFMLETGSYLLRIDARTANEGETGHLRVIAYDTYHSILINNEWNTIEIPLIIKSPMDLEFKISGAPIATSIQDYDIANITLINVVDTLPANVEFFERGNFNDPETALEGVEYWQVTPESITYNEDGGFLRIVGRTKEYGGVIVNTGITVYPGATYKVSYDIRCSNEGEAMVARAYVDDKALNISGEGFENSKFMYEITDEWRHVEAEYIPGDMVEFSIRISGGMDPIRDLCDFDIDNLSIVKIEK